jgi:hypothetical protein
MITTKTTRCLRLTTKPASSITLMGPRHMSSLPVQLHLQFWERMKMESFEDTSSKTSKRFHATGNETSSQNTNGIQMVMSFEQILMELLLSGTESQPSKTSSSPTSSLTVYKSMPTALVNSKGLTEKTKSLLCIGSRIEK